ncbi:hypothetical protein PT2222_70195 [Paraburkholderia tropica]
MRCAERGGFALQRVLHGARRVGDVLAEAGNRIAGRKAERRGGDQKNRQNANVHINPAW